jgi:exopolysaccharide biosynthesis predicted pyruvyltransferase EpsI
MKQIACEVFEVQVCFGEAHAFNAPRMVKVVRAIPRASQAAQFKSKKGFEARQDSEQATWNPIWRAGTPRMRVQNAREACPECLKVSEELNR